MQGRYCCDEIETVIGKWVSHDVALDKRDILLSSRRQSAALKCAVISVDGGHFPAAKRKLSGERASPAPYVKRALATGRNRLQ